MDNENIYSDILNTNTNSNTHPTNFMKSYDYENVAITDIVNNIIVDSINNYKI